MPKEFLRHTKLACATALLATIFWAVGLWIVPHPIALAAILGGALLLTVAATSGAIEARRHRQRRARYGAPLATAALLCLSWMLISNFLLTLFRPSIDVVRFAQALEAPHTTTLRILGFNVLHGYPLFYEQEERYGHTLEALRELDLDVLLLQEAWITRRDGHFVERLSRDLGLQAVYARANGSLRFLGFEEGAAILSRYPISEARGTLLPHSPLWERRIGLSASIELPDASVLRVVSVHLSHNNPRAALEQARFLSQQLAVFDSHIVAGDLNAGRHAAPTLALTSGRLEPAVSSGIDHILVSSQLPTGWKVGKTAVALRPDDGRLGAREIRFSDHPALVLEIARDGDSV